MGACACGFKASSELIFKEFWDKILLRSKPANDWTDMIKLKMDTKGPKRISDKKWITVIDALLTTPENKEASTSMWRNAMVTADISGGEYLIFLSCLFLVKKNSYEVKKNFEDLAKTVCNMKELFKNVNNSLMFKKNKLMEVVKFYVNLISLFSVKELSYLSSNKKEFEDYHEDKFRIQLQSYWIEEEIFGSSTNEWIDLDDFFETQYPKLINDSDVRSRLIEISELPVFK